MWFRCEIQVAPAPVVFFTGMKLLKLAEADLSKIALLPRLLQPMPTFSNS